MPRPTILCRPVAGTDETALHHRIRHEVFVLEQEVFSGSDRDVRDAMESTIKVVAWAAAEGGGFEAGGAVRLYPLGDGGWQGDRLAVLPPFRAWNLGGPLVRFAVDTAAAIGGTEMLAHVQTANVRFFERLGWERRGEPEIYVGLPHQLMAIDLTVPARRPALAPVEDRSPALSSSRGRSPSRRLR
jgi:putative N-acetyltransferase (TIGR04045 family)